jgi:hypothetical protein
VVEGYPLSEEHRGKDGSAHRKIASYLGALTLYRGRDELAYGKKASY